MPSVRSMVGLAVLLEGRRLGRVADVELDDSLTRMTGLFVDSGLGGIRRIDNRQVQLLGRVSVMVSGRGKRCPRPDPALRRALLSDGSRVGAITGAMINSQTRKVEALELSASYLEDILWGRRWIFRYAVRKDGADILVMPEGGERP